MNLREIKMLEGLRKALGPSMDAKAELVDCKLDIANLISKVAVLRWGLLSRDAHISRLKSKLERCEQAIEGYKRIVEDHCRGDETDEMP